MRPATSPSSPRNRPDAVTAFGLSFLLAVSATGCQWARPVLHAAEVESVPVPNRLIEVNSTWADAKPLVVKVQPPGMDPSAPGLMVTLRAVHDHQALSILAVWDDRTESEERSVWVWNEESRQYFRLETPSDLFAMKFCIEGAEDACMMSGGEGIYDVWEWRGGWTHVTGYADDRTLNITRVPPVSGEFSRYPLSGLPGPEEDPRDMIHVQWKDDAGEPPFVPVPRPNRYERAMMNAIRAQQPTGSAGDVKAEAVYQKTGWELEIYRALVTGNDDDYQIKDSGRHRFSIAITDGQEGAQHLTSGLIDLKLDW